MSPLESKRSSQIELSQIMIPLLLFIFAILHIYFPKINIRWKVMFVGFLYLGAFKASMLSCIQIVNFALNQAAPFLKNPLTYVLLGLTILTSLIWGNVYCGSICPFALIQEYLPEAKKIFFKKTKPFNSSLCQKIKGTKYLILICALLTHNTLSIIYINIIIFE